MILLLLLIVICVGGAALWVNSDNKELRETLERRDRTISRQELEIRRGRGLR